jgi:Leucine-rich repeat (LRR) protein
MNNYSLVVKQRSPEIDFAKNEIDDLHPDLFSGCKKLANIDFSCNKLKELNDDLFCGCKESLEVIDFSSNSIEKLAKIFLTNVQNYKEYF